MIEIKNLRKTYGDKTVLDIDSLTVKKGEILVVAGPNGSGKSTLLKIIAGVIKASEGTVVSEGEIFYLPQQSVPFAKTVRRNLLFAAKDKLSAKERCSTLLNELVLNELADKNALALSGGECQRLALGRVLMNKGDCLLLDEPTSAADIEGGELMEKAIKRYQAQTGCAIIMTTHSPAQALSFGHRIIMLNRGTIAEQGSASELLAEPETDWGKKFVDMWKI